MQVFGFQSVKIGSPKEKLTKKYDTSAESKVPGAVPGVGLMLIASVIYS